MKLTPGVSPFLSWNWKAPSCKKISVADVQKLKHFAFFYLVLPSSDRLQITYILILAMPLKTRQEPLFFHFQNYFYFFPVHNHIHKNLRQFFNSNCYLSKSYFVIFLSFFETYFSFEPHLNKNYFVWFHFFWSIIEPAKVVIWKKERDYIKFCITVYIHHC